MEWNLTIPKIAHFYWGGQRLPYLRFLTIKTFLKLNPDWKAIFWYPEYPVIKATWDTGELDYDVECDDYMPELLKLPIEKHAVDIDFIKEMPEVHKSDYMRLLLLSTIGGLWSDMDIFYFKPMVNLEVNTKENKDSNTFVCVSEYGHSISFLMASENNKKFKNLLDTVKMVYDKEKYQCIGSTMYNRVYRTANAMGAINIRMDAVYPHDADHIIEILDGTPPNFTNKTIGIHWYAGHPLWCKFFRETNGGLINLEDNIIGNLLRNERKN